ncbi:MAG: ferredoxin family protein [Syntrophobacteraceae bacterium]
MECARQNYNWIKIDEDKCTGCGLCVEYCPRDVFRMSDENYSCVKYRDDCWYCDVCTFVCPAKAITIEEVPYLVK